jgi:hypothetical protein
MVEHPGGGLVATLNSDQGATLVLFARVADGADLRVLRRALVLDCDGYGAQVFSSDGRRFANRGNAYENWLTVFEFPSLTRVLITSLGDPYPGARSVTDEWRAQTRSWSRHNIAFAVQPGVLWIGAPSGELIEYDVDNDRAAGHEVLAHPVTALSATAVGDLVAATGDGGLALLSVSVDSHHGTRAGQARAADMEAMRAMVEAFVAGTSEAPSDGDPWDVLALTDGTRIWEPGDLESVTIATPEEPSWLQIQAAMNRFREQKEREDWQ